MVVFVWSGDLNTLICGNNGGPEVLTLSWPRMERDCKLKNVYHKKSLTLKKETMKNLLFAAAIAALFCAGCTADDPTSPTPPQEIPVNFITSISQVTRTNPVDGENFGANAKIAVFGTETKTAGSPNLAWMNNVELTKDADKGWIYADSKNFMQGYDYSFVAYAPYRETPLTMTTLAAVPYSVSNVMSGQEDFMYVSTVEKKYSTATPVSGDKVPLAFKHALSQVKFSALTSADYSEYYDVKITKIEIPGLVSEGTLDFTTNTGTWTLDEDAKADYSQTVAASVAKLSNTEVTKLDSDDGVLMLIPQSPKGKDLKLTIQVTANTKGDATVAAAATSVTVQFPVDDPTWKAGYAYTYKITLNLDTTFGWSVAGFEPSITDWVTEERPIN